jgi:hypothetical protein
MKAPLAVGAAVTTLNQVRDAGYHEANPDIRGESQFLGGAVGAGHRDRHAAGLRLGGGGAHPEQNRGDDDR